jgi:hypothetical protein
MTRFVPCRVGSTLWIRRMWSLAIPMGSKGPRGAKESCCPATPSISASATTTLVLLGVVPVPAWRT